MYTTYYNLREKPFKEAIDPKFTWLSQKHLEALSAFKYAALEKKGFFLLTGEVGTGKTTVIKRFLNEIESNTIVANVLDPDLNKLDFFNYLSEEFKMNMTFKSKADFLITFKKFLLDACQKNISALLIIDEAHKIKQELLEEIRVLSNIETYESKLINVFFVGQTEFNNILLDKRNRGLRLRISVNYHLEPLSEDETEQLILYRLNVAGRESKIFSSTAFHAIYQFSAGVPRLVITICDRAMLTGFTRNKNIIDQDIISECAEELKIVRIEEEKEPREKFTRISRLKPLEAKARGEGEEEPKKSLLSEKDIILKRTEELKIDKVEEEREYREKLKRISRPKPLATKAHEESDEKLKKPSISELGIKIIPITKKALLPALSAMLAVVIIYLLYNFTLVFFPKTRIMPSQKKSAVIQSEHSDLSATKKKENEFEKNIIKSTILEEKQAKMPSDSYSTDNIRSEKERISSFNESKLSTVELAKTQTVIDYSPKVSEDTRLLPKVSDTEIKIALKSKKKAPEEFSQKKEIKMERSSSKESEIDKNLELAKKELRNLVYSLDSNLDSTTTNRQEKKSAVARLQPKSTDVIGQEPKKVSKPTGDYLSQQEPRTVKVIRKETEEDLKPKEDARSQQSVTKKIESQIHSVEFDLELKTKAQQEPAKEVAHLEQLKEESNRRNRFSLEERLQSFLQNYCQTYEAKDLDEFTAFFTMDAKENDKPFYSLLPKYRHNFNSIDLINYQIELHEYKYNEEDGTVNIEGRFFLKWLPHGANWRQNSGKIFMELHEHGTSYRVNRLDYYGERRKKTK